MGQSLESVKSVKKTDSVEIAAEWVTIQLSEIVTKGIPFLQPPNVWPPIVGHHSTLPSGISGCSVETEVNTAGARNAHPELQACA